MTNKVICAEKVEELVSMMRDQCSDGGGIAICDSVLNALRQGRFDPSPAPAGGVISTVTNCPTCGAECTVEGKTTHYYVPRTAPSAQWLPMETAPKDGTYIVLNIPNAAHPLVGNWFSSVSFRNGWWVANTVPVQPTGWLPIPTPTTNTREGM